MAMPTLVVLAAGLGSRYGGLKQLVGVGPGGETLLEYSVYDAIRGGFEKAVFVIRPEIEEAFRAGLIRKFERHIQCRCVHQTLYSGLDASRVPTGRVKPWGTGHAVLVAREEVREPFAVINADDYYGRDSIAGLADHLFRRPDESALVGYLLRNTLSEHGSVARGVCSCDESMSLEKVVERTAIHREGSGGWFVDDRGTRHTLTGDELVSMNLWGFHPTFFDQLQSQFDDFLATRGDDPGAEFFLPSAVNRLIELGQVRVRVLASEDRWFGVTYREDEALVRRRLLDLTRNGLYPERLW
jgi:UTP-glucose-1-phosphate uridylyltransferase